MNRILRLALALTLGFGFVVSTLPAQADKIDDFVRASMRQQKIPGLALAVMRDGKIIKAQGYGLANIELNVPVNPETIFQSGSMGKQFTATGVMMLVEEGKVNLDDKITKYFEGAPPGWNAITVRHLLTHTSGIKDYTGEDFEYRKDYTEDELLKKVETFPPDFAPGDKWSYSNSGYMLLGILIRKATGKFYGDFLQERIFRPLGMTTTRIISETDIIPHRAAGYRLVKGELKNQEWVSPSLNTTADGALYFTVLDLAKWDAALYTEELLKRSSFDRMWTAVKLNNATTYPYGFGWGVSDIRGHRIVEHGGAWQGFTTGISRYVDDKLTVVALANLDSGHARPDEIIHGVAGLYDQVLAPLPLPEPIADKEPEVTALFRDLLRKAGAGQADEAAFTEEARKQWFPDRIKLLRESLEDQGPVRSVDLLERSEKEGIRAYRYRLIFDNGRVVPFTLSLDAQNKIAGLKRGSEE